MTLHTGSVRQRMIADIGKTDAPPMAQAEELAMLRQGAPAASFRSLIAWQLR